MSLAPLVVGMDAAWGGIGWSICTPDGPLEAGHYRPTATWREAQLTVWLREVLEPIVQSHASTGRFLPPRLVIERLPWHYSGRRGPRGRAIDPTRTVYGIATCQAHCVSWALRPEWGAPWRVPPRAQKATDLPGWRQWWGIPAGASRGRLKQHAIRLVHGKRWGGLLLGLEPIDADGDGPQGDTAEGILIGMGGALHIADAPKGPRRWPSMGAAR